MVFFSHTGNAQQLAASVFNEGFLDIGGDQPHADLSIFSFSNQVVPGDYVVDVVRNGDWLGQSQVRFAAAEGKQDVRPCLTTSLLDSWGVNPAAFRNAPAAQAAACIDLEAAIPDATAIYDTSKQRMLLSIPQIALKRSARGSVDPSKWDRGVTAAMLDYQLNLTRYDNPNGQFGGSRNFAGSFGQEQPENSARSTVFAGLRGGFNLGDWRFRHYSTYDRGQLGDGRWQSVQTSLQRDLKSIRGQLVLGDGYTPGTLFDSFQFRGMQLSSDDAMLPDSMQGYAPTIRGVAQTNARVTVRQNGYIIYNTYVAPGPFVLDDLYPTSSGGDLEVAITEADGRVTRYIQAYAAVPTLLREGAWRYSASAGQFRSGYSRYGDEPRPYFLQGTLARGLPMDFSVYGGTILSQKYQAAMAGVGKNMYGLGAVSMDITQARTTDERNTGLSGQSLRFLYSKSVEATDTTFRMAGYRYSTSGYRTFSESVAMRAADEVGLPFSNRRSEIRLDVSQPLGDQGALFASARQQSYWGSSRNDRLIQIGYSGSYRQVSYNIFYSQYSNLYGPSNRQAMLTLSIPLGDTNANGTYSISRDSNGRVAQQASLFGSAFDDYRLTYGITADNSNQDGASGSANLNYKGRSGQLSMGRSQGRGYGQTTLGVAGGIVAHADGVTLSQPLGETIALIRVPQAADVGVESQTGVRTDWAGQAIVPSLTPYRTNRLALVTQDLGDNVEVKYAVRDVVPTRGAVVLAPFETAVGHRLMLTLVDANGQPLPFGARVENEAGSEIGMVGPGGQTYIAGANQAGLLKVVWGRQKDERCQATYRLPEEESNAQIRKLKDEVCR